MITAALYSVPVARHERDYDRDDAAELARISAEIAERLEEMNELKKDSGADLVCRLASVARVDMGAFNLVVAVMHGRTESLLTSYEAQADGTGRKKQTWHYRAMTSIALLQQTFPEVGAVLEQIRTSVDHHEEPQSKADVLRGASSEE